MLQYLLKGDLHKILIEINNTRYSLTFFVKIYNLNKKLTTNKLYLFQKVFNLFIS